jgi:NAD(P)-dependent dehydrogenase (short-subunit alcohol dehydrogenase family)
MTQPGFSSMMTPMPVNGGPHPGPSFENQRVVVTGGARGIGSSIVRAFAVQGAKTVIIDLLIDEATSLAGDVGGHAVKCDLADQDDTVKAMNEAISKLGGIDVLVNNAGVFKITPLLDISAEEWDWVFAINTRAMLLTTQVAARAMIDQGSGGKIVNTASMGGKVGAANQAHYAASKAAVISLTQVSAAELGVHNINVNSICPGYVLTEMGAESRTPEMVAEWSALSPLGRLADPSDVASMALFLASDDASYCTGQAMNVTGGMISH